MKKNIKKFMRFCWPDSWVDRTYSVLFYFGVLIFIFQLRMITWETFSSGFPIAAILAGSYFWIRLDVWRTDNTIKQQSDKNKSLQTDLFQRRVDCRIALFLLALAAVIQAAVLKSLISIGVLFMLIFFANKYARLRQRKWIDS